MLISFLAASLAEYSALSGKLPTREESRRLQTSVCSDTCAFSANGLCEDGGSGTVYYDCDLGTDCTDCGARVVDSTTTPGANRPTSPSPPLVPLAPPQPQAATSVCSDTCAFSANGLCEDGGSGTVYYDCDLGTDCSDCGVRNADGTITPEVLPPPPPSPSPPPPSPQTATATSGCSDTCAHAANGLCEDGGSGTVYYDCDVGTDCTDCGARNADGTLQALSPTSPSQPTASQAPPQLQATTAICSDTCAYALNGLCEDGGSDTVYYDCNLGTDCTDCGVRNADGTTTLEAISPPLPPSVPHWLSSTNVAESSVAVIVLGIVAVLACIALCTFALFVRTRERKGDPIFRPIGSKIVVLARRPADVQMVSSTEMPSDSAVVDNVI